MTVRHARLRRLGAGLLIGLVLASIGAPSAFAAKSGGGGTTSTAPVTGRFAVSPATVVVGSATILRFSFAGTTSGSRTIRMSVPSSFTAPQTLQAFSSEDLTGLGWVGNEKGCLSLTSGDVVATNAKTTPRYIQFTLGCRADLSSGSIDFVGRTSATGSQKFSIFVAPSTTAFSSVSVSSTNGKIAITSPAEATAGSAITLSAKVTDAKGVVVAGAPVRFTDGLGATFSEPQIACPDITTTGVACTNSLGIATIRFLSDLAGAHQVRVTILGTSNGVQKAISVTPGPVSLVTVSGVADDLVAGDSRVITVAAEDLYGNTVSLASGHAATLVQDASDTGSVSGLGDSALAADGTSLDFTVVGGSLGDVTLTADVDGVASDAAAPIAFRVVAGTLATLAFDDASVTLSSGDSATTVTLHGLDAGGNAVDISAATATFEQAGGGTISIGTPSGTGDGGLSVDLVGVTEGTGLLTATIDGTSATLAFTVTPGALAAIRLDGSRADLTSGGTRTFTVVGLDAAGNVVDLAGETVTVAAGDSDSGSVAISGLASAGLGVAFDVTGGSRGSVLLTATRDPGAAGELTATAGFDVIPGDPILAISLAAGELTSGTTWTVGVSAADAAGNSIDLTNATVGLAAGGMSVGTVAIGTGVPGTSWTFPVLGVTEGSVVLVATLDGRSAEAGLTVVPGTLDRITIAASATSIVVGSELILTVAGLDGAGNRVALDAATVSVTCGDTGGFDPVGAPTQSGALVTVTAQGAVAGDYACTASLGSMTASTSVSVTEPLSVGPTRTTSAPTSSRSRTSTRSASALSVTGSVAALAAVFPVGRPALAPSRR